MAADAAADGLRIAAPLIQASERGYRLPVLLPARFFIASLKLMAISVQLLPFLARMRVA